MNKEIRSENIYGFTIFFEEGILYQHEKLFTGIKYDYRNKIEIVDGGKEVKIDKIEKYRTYIKGRVHGIFILFEMHKKSKLL